MKQPYNLSVPPNEFTIDAVPTIITKREFSGKDRPLIEIVFTDPETGNASFEKSASIDTFAFNGTAVLTPSALNDSYDLNVHDIGYGQLEGKLLSLEFEPGKQYGSREVTEMLKSHPDIYDAKGNRTSRDNYIVLIKTGLMDEVLKTVDENGIPDYDQLAKVQENRAGLTPEGARALRIFNIAKAYMIDNISFEPEGGIDEGGIATQLLMRPDQENRKFIPLVYHVANTTGPTFDSIVKDATARIELGNMPSAPLPGYAASVRLYK